MFSTNLNDEYRRVADAFDLGVAQVADLVRNAVKSSFLGAGDIRALLDDIDRVQAAHSP